MYSYQLTSTGFQVFKNGALYIDQAYDFSQPGWVPYASTTAADLAAKALIAKLPI